MTMNPNETQGKEIFYELGKTIKKVIWLTALLVWWVKHGKRIFDLLTNLMGAFLFGIILIGIWSDDPIYLRVAFTVLVSGIILILLLKAVIDFTKKPAPKKEPSPPMSEGAKNMMIMSIIMDKFKNDEGYRKEVAKKFYDDLMEKKIERGEGEQEPKDK